MPLPQQVDLSAHQANAMAATLDAEQRYRAGDTLPAGWHWLYFTPTAPTASLGSDGHPVRDELLPSVSGERRMWASGKLRFLQPLIIGSTISRVQKVTANVEKVGRSGRLRFVTVESEISCAGEIVLVEEQTLVYKRGKPVPGEARSVPSPTTRTAARDLELSSIHLFRYSALTFNSHRIHFDADYAREVEHYPGLVVHGPLMATLLMDFASSQGVNLREFNFRGVAPLCLPQIGKLCSNLAPDRGSGTLWIEGADGSLVMEAQVSA